MKIILDNIIYSHVKQGGVSNYWFELSKFLLNKKENVFFYENNEPINNFHRNQLEIPKNRIILNNNKSKFSTFERMSAVKINDSDRFLYHSSYYRSLSAKNENHIEITTVHDFTHNFFSSFFKKSAHNLIKYNSINKSNGIICISNNTYKDLLKFCPPKKNQKVVIINNGVSNDFFVIEPSKIESQFKFSIKKNSYILYVGSRESYKNFNFVIELLKLNANLKLIVVGNSFSAKEISLIGERINQINIVSNVSNQDLNILYNNALAFVYPSSYEGFGIPVIESMKAGCPVIALNSSSIPEVAGNSGILIDKLDVTLTSKILKNLKHSDYRLEVIEKGIVQSKKYSWDKCCKETLDFYNEMY